MPYTTLRMAQAATEAAQREEGENEEDPLTSAWVAQLNRPRGPDGMAIRWVPDSSVLGCMNCAVRFTLVRRRHHCRRCGACICDKCSTARVPTNLLPQGRPKIKNDSTTKIPKVLERGIDVIADDTALKYVRCCNKCAKIIDTQLKSAIRSRHRSSPNAILSTKSSFSTPTGKNLQSSFDEDEKDNSDAISV